MNTLIVLQQMIVLFAIMMVGYFCYKKSWLDKNAYGKLSKIVVNVMNPMLIINGVINKDAGNDYGKIIQNLILIVVYFVLLICLSFLVVKILKLENSVESLYRLMLVFSNVGFIGIPIISSVYGETSVLYIAFYILGYNFLLYTYGLHLVSLSVQGEQKQTGKDSFKKMFNAGVIACIAAIMIFACRITVPAPVEAFISYMGEPAVPLSMVLIGASMAQQEMKKLFTDLKMYLFLIIRLLIIPMAAALIIRNFAVDAEIAGVFILMLAMPVGSIVVLLAADQGADETCCTKGSILSTLFSVITIPIVSLLLF
ncbi:MAG: AEC family transporter [Lachnospiraceae bacterium]|nr:AEC family transporter [Lachnospiraceae bacterium]